MYSLPWPVRGLSTAGKTTLLCDGPHRYRVPVARDLPAQRRRQSAGAERLALAELVQQAVGQLWAVVVEGELGGNERKGNDVLVPKGNDAVRRVGAHARGDVARGKAGGVHDRTCLSQEPARRGVLRNALVDQPTDVTQARSRLDDLQCRRRADPVADDENRLATLGGDLNHALALPARSGERKDVARRQSGRARTSLDALAGHRVVERGLPGLTFGEDQISLVISSAGDSVRTGPSDTTEHRRGSAGDRPKVAIAFVNNMPSSAFDATEQQFVGLLEGAAREVGVTVALSRYVLAGLDRSAEVEQRVARDYRGVESIFDERPDGLVVTGTEPLARDLRAEPFWEDLSGLITWAEKSTQSAIVSCLAAHAAALLFDGIERETLPSKCSGVFVQEVRPGHVLTAGLGQSVSMPHSRLNDLPSALLAKGGYTNLIESPEMDWTVAVKDRGSCTFVLVQGHPGILDDKPVARVPPRHAALLVWRAQYGAYDPGGLP